MNLSTRTSYIQNVARSVSDGIVSASYPNYFGSFETSENGKNQFLFNNLLNFSI